MSLENLKNTIKEIPISEVVESYIPLVRKGNLVQAVCPFHDDHNPSMSVHDGKGIFKCFVCGASGDSISFVTKYKNFEFIEAIREIADKFSIPTDAIDQKKQKDPRREMAEKLLLVATQIYEKHAQNAASKPAHDFFQDRKIKPETVKHFRLGYSPPNHSLKYYLKSLPADKREFALQIAQEIGLIGKSKKTNDYYDTFTNRIMFPLWDSYGTLVGFSSRTLRPDLDKRKYLNSRESFIFHKKNVLYGLNFAKPEIRSKEQLIIVEGQMDVIALHQNDFKTAVACSGISLDPSMRDLLLKLTKNVFLSLDSDLAGISASRKINALFLQSGVIAKYLQFTDCKDVDEFLTAKGGLELSTLIDTAPTFIDYELQELFKLSPQSIEKKLETLEKAFEILAPLGENLLANEKLVSFAKNLGLKSGSEEIIKNFKDFVVSNTKPSRNIVVQEEPEPVAIQMPTPSENEKWTLCANERYLLEAILTLPAILNHDKFLELLDFVEHYEVKQLICGLRETPVDFSEKRNLQQAIGQLVSEQRFQHTELRAFFDKRDFMIQTEVKEDISSEKLVFDLGKKLKTNSLLRQRDQLKFDQENLDDPSLLQLNLGKRLDIEKQLNELKKEKYIP